MDEIGTDRKSPRRHLLTPETLAHATQLGQRADLTRHHGQSNGMRVHALYFAAVSLLALALVITAVIVANATP